MFPFSEWEYSRTGAVSVDVALIMSDSVQYLQESFDAALRNHSKRPLTAWSKSIRPMSCGYGCSQQFLGSLNFRDARSLLCYNNL